MKTMELIGIILEMKRKSYHWLGQQCNESPSQIYNRRVAKDIQVETLKKYCKAMGCRIVIEDEYSPARWVIE